jgi:hypothetical protein
MERIILSAVVLIITNLILGSISLSLGLVVAIILVGVALIALVFFALLGICLMLEKVGWLSSGWTDSRIDRLRTWATRKWHAMPAWYASEKKRIIEMLIERLRGREKSVAGPVKMWKWAAVGLIVLLAIVLVKYRLNLTVGWSLTVVALGSLVISVPVMYFAGPKGESNGGSTDVAHDGDPLRAVTGMDATPEEIRAALAALVELHRSGKLTALLERTSDTNSRSED